MKKIVALFAVSAAALLMGAEPVNRVGAKWYVGGAKAPQAVCVVQKSGQLDFSSVGKDAAGKMFLLSANQHIKLNQKTARPIRFGGECKAEKVSGAKNRNFSIYLDIVYTDGKPLYGQVVEFANGTYDWTKKETTITPAKPIKSISYYVLFRSGVTGKASVRNCFLYEK